MNKLISALCATAIAVSFTAASFVPAQAGPVSVPLVNAPISSDVQTVDSFGRSIGNGDYWRYRNNGFRNGGFRDNGWRNDGWRRDGRNWRRHGGYYRDRNLGGAIVGGLITGAIVGGVLNNSRPVYRERVYRGGNSHIQWCYDRYRSYRASDNTFQPYNGPRQQCYSPY